MVNAGVTDAGEAERRLAIGYAPPPARAVLATLLALDRRLGQVAVVGREPMLAQMRLTWWHDALRRLDEAPPPPEPILTAVAADVLPHGVTGAGLAAMVDGWEAMLADPLDDAALALVGRARGGTLFAVAATMLGASDPAMMRLGEGWALADAARRLAGDAAVRATELARGQLEKAPGDRLPVPLRALGALALSAQADLDGIPPGSLRRVARLAWHRLTGR